MKEYVDVQVLKQQDFQDYSNTDVEYAIDHCPRADVAEVVRCRDCIKRNTPDCAMYYKCSVCGGQWNWENDNGFCSFGERKEAEHPATDVVPKAYSKLFSDMVIGMLSCGVQSVAQSKYEEAIDYLLALACCTTPQLSCRDCPKYKEGHDEDEVTPCESWKDEDILEAVKFIKKMKGAK